MDKVFVVVHEFWKHPLIKDKSNNPEFINSVVSAVFKDGKIAKERGEEAAKVFEGLIKPADEMPYLQEIKTKVFEMFLI